MQKVQDLTCRVPVSDASDGWRHCHPEQVQAAAIILKGGRFFRRGRVTGNGAPALHGLSTIHTSATFGKLIF